MNSQELQTIRDSGQIIRGEVWQVLDYKEALKTDPRLCSKTRSLYLGDLDRFTRWQAGRPFTKSIVNQYAAEMQEAGKSPRTINRSLACIRWWARYLADYFQELPAISTEEKLRRAELVATASHIGSVRDIRVPKNDVVGRHISQGELRALIEVCQTDSSPYGFRDAAIIAIAWTTGMRRAEIADLTMDDLTFNDDSTADIRVEGKGKNIRTAYLDNGSYDAVMDWLEIRGNDLGKVFYYIPYRGKAKHISISGAGLRVLLNKRMEQAGIKPLAWHDFRRTFAGNLLNAGVDLATVQRLMGHCNPTTTSNYDRRGDQTRRQAISTLHVPYKKYMKR